MISFFYFIACYFIASCSAIQIAQKFTNTNVRALLTLRPNYLIFLRLKSIAIVTFIILFDLIKAIIPLYGAFKLGFNSIELTMFTLAVILGHYYSIFNKFKGELGATLNIGIYTAIGWPFMFISVALWLISYYISGYRAVANIIVAFAIPIPIAMIKPTFLPPVLFLAIIICVKHFPTLIKIRYGYYNADCSGLIQHYLAKKDFLS